MKSLSTRDNRKNLLLYFQVHQPLRLRKFKFFDIGTGNGYFDDTLNQEILERISRECYLPANMLLLKLIKENPEIRIAFSVSGLALDQFADFAPEVLYSFRALAESGSVEFLGETHYHSLACMIDGDEFEKQVRLHTEKLEYYLGVTPVVFRNTELIYSNEIGKRVHKMGFKGIFCDGIEKIMGYRSAHHLYEHPDNDLAILLRNYRLSDDIAFRFQQADSPLTVEKYVSWIETIPPDQTLVNIAMDYETFGEHQKKSSGIFSFLENLLTRLSNHDSLKMISVSDAIQLEKRKAKLSVPLLVSWADRERDLSAWLGNVIQQDAFDSLISLKEKVLQIGDPRLLHCWRMLQTSDHFYYMCTKQDDDGNVHAYFSPYPSPYEAFINYMNVVSDFTMIIKRRHAALPILQEKKHFEFMNA